MFYNKFIESLCDVENLQDISSLGRATQSSTFGNIDNFCAQNALIDMERDFHFHTDKETNPWWQVDFDEAEFIKYIIINNRKDYPYDSRAIQICVEGKDENNNIIIFHQGASYFGSLPIKMPLIVNTNANQKIKSIRVYLRGKKQRYLHLSRIYILKKKSLQEVEGKMIFLSNRTDGLGERIRAILNVSELANIFNGQFKFTWKNDTIDNSFHAIQNSSKVFSDIFCEKHIIDLVCVSKMNLMPLSDINSKMTIDRLMKYDAILVNQGSINTYLLGKKICSKEFQYDRSFSCIKFNDNIESVINIAKNIKMEKSVAIHVRMGDIVYGDHRYDNSYYDKIIPTYLLDAIVKKYRESNFNIIIFSSNYEFCHSYCHSRDLDYAAKYYQDDFDMVQKAIFDIVLMSRCDEIVAGKSGFAILSSWLGGADIKNILNVLNKIDIVESIKSSISKPVNNDNLLNAFSISHFLCMFEKYIVLNDRLDYIKYAIKLDSKNPLYKIIQAAYLFEEGNIFEGEEILLSEIEKGVDLYRYTKRNSINLKKTALTLYLDRYKQAANKGSLIAATFVLLYEYHLQNILNTEFYSRLLKESSRQKSGWLELETKLRELTK